jgi:hypothetical protein
MLDIKYINSLIYSVLGVKGNNPSIKGKGIILDTTYFFDQEKLNQQMLDIAHLFQELGVGEQPLVRLSSLTKLKNGTTWNNLLTMDDFNTLNILLACGNACDFIINDDDVRKQNKDLIGNLVSHIISTEYIELGLNQSIWLRIFKDSLANKMIFPVNSQILNSYIKQNLSETNFHLCRNIKY